VSATADLLLGDEPLDPAPRKRRARKPIVSRASEAQVQRAIIDWLRWKNILAVHIPNEGKRSAHAGKRLKGEGMRPGFPDLVVYGAGGRHVLLEVKRPGWRPSDVSDNQRAMHARLRELGAVVEVVASIDDTRAVLRAAGWPV
jgi:hypothetical protein